MNPRHPSPLFRPAALGLAWIGALSPRLLAAGGSAVNDETDLAVIVTVALGAATFTGAILFLQQRNTRLQGRLAALEAELLRERTARESFQAQWDQSQLSLQQATQAHQNVLHQLARLQAAWERMNRAERSLPDVDPLSDSSLRPRRHAPVNSHVHLADILPATLDELRGNAPSCWEVSHDLASELPAVRAEPQQVRQAILFVGRHLRKRMRDTGVVRVRAHHGAPPAHGQPAAFVRITLHAQGVISDAGELSRDLHRLPTGDWADGPGLSLARAIVEMIHGSLSVSCDSDGTAFVLQLPVSDPTPRPPPGPGAGPA